MSPADLEKREAGLIRALGVPGLTANIINTTIGAGIFALPAGVAFRLGAAAPVAFAICAVAMGLFVTCFALAGSRVSLTGGLYAYVEVAFGRYIGFLTAAMLFLSAVLSVAGVVTLFAASLAALIPALNGPVGRTILTGSIYFVLALINIRGVRAGSRTVAVVTAVKLIPLLVFIVIGVFFIQPSALAWPGWPNGETLGGAVLLLMFAFVGIEVALVPSGEVKNPSRTVPRAIYSALVVTTFIYVAIQLVAQGILASDLGNQSATPLAEAASRFLGDGGRTLLLAGATISAFGFVTSDILGSPRYLFALARDGILPKAFSHLHPRFRSPDLAIVAYTAVAFGLSLSSSFESLAVMANVAVLFAYLLCSAAAWELIRRDVRADGPPLRFRGDRIVPFFAIAAAIWILTHATRDEFRVAGIVAGVASVLYLVRIGLMKR
ncbi:MAG TPA: APC family permease [Chthoniobacterales bacterium]|jgi:amino acid transporter|nr:APC family permease [Chthoniobacterales bacterium]